MKVMNKLRRGSGVKGRAVRRHNGQQCQKALVSNRCTASAGSMCTCGSSLWSDRLLCLLVLVQVHHVSDPSTSPFATRIHPTRDLLVAHLAQGVRATRSRVATRCIRSCSRSSACLQGYLLRPLEWRTGLDVRTTILLPCTFSFSFSG